MANLPKLVQFFDKFKNLPQVPSAIKGTGSRAINAAADDAAIKQWQLPKNIGRVAGGVGNAALWDTLSNRPGHEQDLTTRILLGALNVGVGGFSGGRLVGPRKAIGNMSAANPYLLTTETMVAAPLRDALITGIKNAPEATKALSDVAEAANKLQDAVSSVGTAASNVAKQNSDANQEQVSTSKDNQKLLKQIAIATLLTSGTLGAAKLFSDYKRDKERKKFDQQGNIKITLPTKKPGDAETQVTLPLGNRVLSQNVRAQIERDIRRRARSESKDRVQHRAERLANITEDIQV